MALHVCRGVRGGNVRRRRRITKAAISAAALSRRGGGIVAKARRQRQRLAHVTTVQAHGSGIPASRRHKAMAISVAYFNVSYST